MKVIVEFEMELELPDTDQSLDSAVQKFLKRTYKTPFGIILTKMHICGMRKVQPWEQSLPRF